MITWDSCAGATYYEAQYYKRANDSWQSDPDYTSGTSYVSTGLSNYDSYEYRVSAGNDAGVSGWTYFTYYTTFSAPSAPTGLPAVPAGENTAEISWNKTAHISNYEVQYYSNKTGAWTADGDYTSKTDTSYVTTGLSNYSSYQFRVRAVNTFGESSWVTVTYVKPVAPSAPTGLFAEAFGEGCALISWNSSPGASSYEVQFYSRSSEAWKTDSDYTGGTSYVSTGMNSYDSYTFRVRAKNEYGSVSDWVEVTYYVESFQEY